MKLIELVDSLPLDVFSELRKAVITRHQRHSTEIAVSLEYLASQKSLIDAISTKRSTCEKVLAKKCSISIDIAAKVIDRFIQLSQQDPRVDKPFQ